jgi:hypothetical protein
MSWGRIGSMIGGGLLKKAENKLNKVAVNPKP